MESDGPEEDYFAKLEIVKQIRSRFFMGANLSGLALFELLNIVGLFS